MLKNATLTLCLAVALAGALVLSAPVLAAEGSREFPASSGGTLKLDLRAGGTVRITGDGGSSVSVKYSMHCTPDSIRPAAAPPRATTSRRSPPSCVTARGSRS